MLPPVRRSSYVQRIVLAAAMRRAFAWVVFIVVSCAGASSALADPRTERDAQALRKKAIEEDNLNVNYPAAVKKLQSALNKCGATRCSPVIKAGLFRDLGAMQILSGASDEGKASFAQALALDSSIELDAAYKNPMLDGVWADVKKNGAAPASAPAAGGARPGPQPGGGDFSHAPPPEGQVNTPLAIYLEYTGSDPIGKVVAKYKGTGMSDWKSLDLKKIGDGYGALIPCKDVQQGSMQYYVVGFNPQNDPVATSGSRNKPYTVAVNPQISGPAPSLPGHDPPAQCSGGSSGATADANATECPPDFPGCNSPKKQAGDDCSKDKECSNGLCIGGKCIEKKGSGEDCEADKECTSGACSDGKCASTKGAGESCEKDDDCTSGSCEDDKCAAPAGPKGALHRWWIGLSFQADIYFMPKADEICKLAERTVNGNEEVNPLLPQNTAGYNCVSPQNNANFPGTTKLPLANGTTTFINDQFTAHSVTGGPILGNLRILASLDMALNANMMLGARLGYVLFTDPATGSPGAVFPPVHLEARFTYLFGRDALISSTVAPLVFAGIGLGEFDAYIPVTVNPLPPPNGPGGGPVAENAWLTSGPFFFSVGAGVRVRLSEHVAGTAALKFEEAVGGSAGSLPGFAPEVGLQFGL
jgi:hypothetical protein